MNSCCLSGAALLGLLLISACSDSSPLQEPLGGNCTSVVSPITAIQGDGYYSQLVDSEVRVRGTVTYLVGEKGFYLEDSEAPADPSSSRALFVSNDLLSLSIEPGQQIEISGRISEEGKSRDKLTSLVDITGFEVCTENNNLPLTNARLPMSSAEREALEGMRVSFIQELTVTDVYKLSDGELTLSSNGVLRVPTEITPPGPAAIELERDNRDRAIVAVLPPAYDSPLPVGAATGNAAGLMGHNDRMQQFFLDSATKWDIPVADPIKPPAAGMLRVVSSNLLNFFNGDGAGGGFPTERGAETLEGFQAQSQRTQAAMAQIQPDLLAVQELENDGFEPGSAARSLLTLLNSTRHDDWAFIAPGPGGIGGDVITVGLFYRQSILQTSGPAHVLDRAEFQGLSRQPLAQVFRDRHSGTRFLVVANHLKSKGSCPQSGENSDQEDGQGCWNPARVAAVKAEDAWLKELAKELGTSNILILGDMNAWRNEDPIRQFRGSGYIDLVEQLAGLPQHSFLYWGQTGTLDYAFASPELAPLARKAFIWHINADRPRNMEQPLPWLRTSDHDPVIVDFDFSQSATSD